jgi:hypothetical protein
MDIVKEYYLDPRSIAQMLSASKAEFKSNSASTSDAAAKYLDMRKKEYLKYVEKAIQNEIDDSLCDKESEPAPFWAMVHTIADTPNLTGM